jgi:uncharacterized membrane protein YqiK
MKLPKFFQQNKIQKFWLAKTKYLISSQIRIYIRNGFFAEKPEGLKSHDTVALTGSFHFPVTRIII